MKNKKTADSAIMTRRVVLTAGVGGALALAIPKYVFGSPGAQPSSNQAPASTDNQRPVLFAFRGSDENTIAIAVTCVASSGIRSKLNVHAGPRNWSFEAPFSHTKAMFTELAGAQVFSGEIKNPRSQRGAPLRALVLEVPVNQFPPGSTADIWAELTFVDGSRFRIGSPFLEQLAANNGDIAKLYHLGSPSHDSEALQRLVGQTIAANARRHGYGGNAEHYGRRVAAALTPDALRYNPQLPVGFTFAAQNGRHPNDDAQVVVDTILNGALSPISHQPSAQLQARFPYFPEAFHVASL